MKHYPKPKYIAIFRLIVVLLVGFIILFDLQWRPMLLACARSQAMLSMTQAINDSFEYAFSNRDVTLDFSTVRYGSDGDVKSISVNNTALNDLKLKFVDHFVDNAQGTVDFSVTLGTLSGISYFNCLGPFMKFFAEISQYPEAQFVSSFEAQGINQTIHRIVLKVDVDVNYIFPGGSDSDNVISEYVVSETVIVGNVPDSYTNIIQNGKTIPDTADTVKIFGD